MEILYLLYFHFVEGHKYGPESLQMNSLVHCTPCICRYSSYLRISFQNSTLWEREWELGWNPGRKLKKCVTQEQSGTIRLRLSSVVSMNPRKTLFTQLPFDLRIEKPSNILLKPPLFICLRLWEWNYFLIIISKFNPFCVLEL